MEIKRISPEETKQMLDSDEGYIYLDVRTVPEFDAGHVPGAKNVPVMDRDPYGRMQLNPAFVEVVEAKFGKDGRCCMIQLRREWGRFSNFSFRTPQRRISAYPARPSG